MIDLSNNSGAPPLVSVCITTVNRLAYLEEALLSVVNQTATDWELVVGENSGEPGYGADVDRLVARIAKGLPNTVRVIHQSTQLSMVGHANALVAAAIGDYVLYLPDDDRLRPECLEELTTPIRLDPMVDIVFCDNWLIDKDSAIDLPTNWSTKARPGREALSPGRVGGEDLIALALLGSFTLQASLIRARVLGSAPFREEAAKLPDTDLFLRLAQKRPQLYVVYKAERLVEYRVHNEQYTRRQVSASEAIDFHDQSLASLGRGTRLPPKSALLHRRLVAQHRYMLAAYYAQSRQWKKFWNTSLVAIRDHPTWVPGYKSLLRRILPAGVRRVR